MNEVLPTLNEHLPVLACKGCKTLLVKIGLIGKDASQRDVEEWLLNAEPIEGEIGGFMTRPFASSRLRDVIG